MKGSGSVTHNSGRILWKAADNQCLQTPFILYYFLVCSVFLGGSQKVNILGQSQTFICQDQNESESLRFSSGSAKRQTHLLNCVVLGRGHGPPAL